MFCIIPATGPIVKKTRYCSWTKPQQPMAPTLQLSSAPGSWEKPSLQGAATRPPGQEDGCPSIRPSGGVGSPVPGFGSFGRARGCANLALCRRGWGEMTALPAWLASRAWLVCSHGGEPLPSAGVYKCALRDGSRHLLLN